VGLFARNYWTPDEPREADIAWRMSWQSDKAVPLLAGEAFCEKPPLTYWAAALPIRAFGPEAWAARLPNLLYAILTALGVGALCRRALGVGAGLVGAAVMSTFLLSYQVAIWLATDAPLLAADAVALLGLYRGFYATERRERLTGYCLMHLALAAAFLCKSAAGWMVPALTLGALIVWERRWRELLRVELYAGLLIQALFILSWIWFVYTGPDGIAHLKVFFWNNLVGRFTKVEAPSDVQYAAAHKNFPGKYLLEMPVYLFPWTLLVLAALRQAWKARRESLDQARAPRFALAVTLPALLVLSVAATARNIYFAPCLPGVALLLCWWGRKGAHHDRWDLMALRATAAVLVLSVIVLLFAGLVIGIDGWSEMQAQGIYVALLLAGGGVAAAYAIGAWRVAGESLVIQRYLMISFLALLTGPLLAIYGEVNDWQDLPSIARALAADADSKPLTLLHPDETTRAIIDMYTRDAVPVVAEAGQTPAGSLLIEQLPGRAPPRSALIARMVHTKAERPSELPGTVIREYHLPNGRRYALIDPKP
jgi:4-amino-4-deoxy-L-arabinose transferase-like glycosyltransferase